jgi:hypothetical protein
MNQSSVAINSGLFSDLTAIETYDVGTSDEPEQIGGRIKILKFRDAAE